MSEQPFPRTVLLAGGVGGARMAAGFMRALPAQALTVVVNVGDDDWFHELRVCPDLDTVMYTLSGQVNAKQAWGVEGDSTRALEVLKRLGAAATWMTLGDADIGLHLYRTTRLRHGATLSDVSSEIARAFGLEVRVLPATDDVVSTKMVSEEGVLSFQEWFVERRCEPCVHQVRTEGAERAVATRQVLEALSAAELIVFAPSNPLLSILPMLRISGLETAVRSSAAAKVVVSPLINGVAVKGPLHKLLQDLNFPSGNLGIAQSYGDLADGFVIDSSDAADAPALQRCGYNVLSTSTRIATPELGESLAKRILEFTGARQACKEA